SIDDIAHLVIIGDEGFSIVNQLEALTEQVSSIIPGQTQAIAPTAIPVPCIHTQMLETRRGLEAAEGIVPPLVARTRTRLDLPLHFVHMITLIADPVLPAPLFSKEPAQRVTRLPL